MSDRKVEAILIDMDGTLVDSFAALFQAYTKFLLLQGKVASREEFLALNGVPIFEILPLLKERHGLYLSLEELQATFKILIEEEYLDAPLMKGAKEFLGWAKMEGIPLAVVTSSRREWVSAILKSHAIEPYFQSVVTRESVTKGKPHPEPFLLAMKELRVTPEKSYAIDDADLGIESATKAGVHVLQFVPGPPYPPNGKGGDWPTLQAILRHALS